MDILHDRLCQRYLKASLTYGPVEVYPKILCIGALKKLKYSVWVKGANSYKQIPQAGYPHKLELLKGNFINSTVNSLVNWTYSHREQIVREICYSIFSLWYR